MLNRGLRLAALGILALILGGTSCLKSGITGPGLGPGRRVLFVGNSYLYTQDIPGMVQALADSAGGDQLAVRLVAGPDVALIDHWYSGVTRPEIRNGDWEWVVLQQGPSSTDVNRDSLRLVTQLFSEDIAYIGARAVLFSAWPAVDRREDFARAIESYTLAANDVGGVLAPVAAAWLAAWDRDPNAPLYADALHPSIAGAYLSALVTYARLLNRSPIGLPATFRMRNGTLVEVPVDLAALLQQAANDVAAPTP